MRYTCMLFGALLYVMQPTYADIIVDDVIDVRPYQTLTHGNMLGLAYDANRQELTFPNGFDGESKVVTITLDGNLVRDWPLSRLIGEESLSGGVTGLSYDAQTDGLFAWTFRSTDGNTYRQHIMHTVRDGSEIVGEFSVAVDTGGNGLFLEGSSIWTSQFNIDSIREYSRDGRLLSTMTVQGFPDGFPGPSAIARAFDGGFFLVDHFDERIVHVDSAGQLVGAISTAELGDGRGMAIATDLDSRRTFLLVNNEQIYVLRGVPEPSAWALFTVGLLAQRVRRRKHRTQ